MNPAALLPPLDPSRVNEIAAFLEGRNCSLAPLRKSQPVWNDLATAEPAARERIISNAEKYLGEPVPVLTDKQYLESRQTDDHFGYPRRLEQRRERTTLFVLAEALENSGRFLRAINGEIAAICAERIWVSPRHDWNRLNFEGTRIDVDLVAAMTAWTLATADTILEEGLDPDVRQAIRGRIRQTVTGPYVGALRGLREEEWWTRNPNNWNPVVHAGIIGAALFLGDEYSILEQAEIIAGAEKNLEHYLKGFPVDGYCPEGIGYWRYGFGHYVLMAEVILVATRGQLSLYGSDHARLIACFPERFELSTQTHFYPPFADTRFREPTAPWLSYLLDQRFGLGREAARVLMPEGDFASGFFSTFLHAWGVILNFQPKLAPPWTGSGTDTTFPHLRDWFEESQVLVSRLPGSEKGLKFALKGGNNGVSHCHTDLGTFIVTVDDVPVLVDPGVTDYGPGTFGPNRYQNQIMGSYGHPVPLVAGGWQGPGASFYSIMVEKEFTAEIDRMTLDLTKAYPVPSLKRLTRCFEYERIGGGKLIVIDQVEFDSPQLFGTALVTYGEFREEGDGVWIVSKDGASARVEIHAGGFPFRVTEEILRDESRIGKVRRLGINLLSLVEGAELQICIEPQRP